MEEDILKTENEKNSSVSFLNRIELKTLVPKEKSLPEEQSSPFMSSFFNELVYRIKKNLSSIKTFTQFSREKFNDVPFGEYFYRSVTDDIDKIDSVLEALLNYIKVNTPIKRKNTLHSILDEGLKNHITQIEDKKIKIIKKFEKDLPETIVHEGQLIFILNSILDYAITSVHPNGTIGFLTKSLDIQKGVGESKTWPQEDGRYIEILIGFTGAKKPIEKLGTVSEFLAVKQEEVIDLILRLVKDMVEKNRGMMKFEVNEKKTETYISLRLPVERRTVVYYQSINAKKNI